MQLATPNLEIRWIKASIKHGLVESGKHGYTFSSVHWLNQFVVSTLPTPTPNLKYYYIKSISGKGVYSGGFTIFTVTKK